MSPEQILQQAVRRAKFAAQTPRNIPIREVFNKVTIPVTQTKPRPVQFVPQEPPAPKFYTVAEISRASESYYGQPKGTAYGRSREKMPTQARHVAMYLATQMTGKSLADIGRYMGDRDHTTVIHGVNKIRRLVATDELVARQIEEIRKLVSSEPSVGSTAGVAGNEALPVGT